MNDEKFAQGASIPVQLSKRPYIHFYDVQKRFSITFLRWETPGTTGNHPDCQKFQRPRLKKLKKIRTHPFVGVDCYACGRCKIFLGPKIEKKLGGGRFESSAGILAPRANFSSLMTYPLKVRSFRDSLSVVFFEGAP